MEDTQQEVTPQRVWRSLKGGQRKHKLSSAVTLPQRDSSTGQAGRCAAGCPHSPEHAAVARGSTRGRNAQRGQNAAYIGQLRAGDPSSSSSSSFSSSSAPRTVETSRPYPLSPPRRIPPRRPGSAEVTPARAAARSSVGARPPCSAPPRHRARCWGRIGSCHRGAAVCPAGGVARGVMYAQTPRSLLTFFKYTICNFFHCYWKVFPVIDKGREGRRKTNKQTNRNKQSNQSVEVQDLLPFTQLWNTCPAPWGSVQSAANPAAPGRAVGGSSNAEHSKSTAKAQPLQTQGWSRRWAGIHLKAEAQIRTYPGTAGTSVPELCSPAPCRHSIT